MPLFAGDPCRTTGTVVAARASKSRPDAGIVTFRHEAHNQKGQLVAKCERQALMKRRPVEGAGA